MSDNNKKETHTSPTPIQDLINDAQRDRTLGPLIGSVIIIVMMIVGSLYFVGTLVQQRSVQIQAVQEQEEVKRETIILETVTQSDSDSLEDIETDLEVTNLNVADDFLSEIQKEF